jgi:hypothetical protein
MREVRTNQRQCSVPRILEAVRDARVFYQNAILQPEHLQFMKRPGKMDTCQQQWKAAKLFIHSFIHSRLDISVLRATAKHMGVWEYLQLYISSALKNVLQVWAVCTDFCQEIKPHF